MVEMISETAIDSVDLTPAPTLEQILEKYPLRRRRFKGFLYGNGKKPCVVSARVSRNEHKTILYVKPGSSKWIQKPESSNTPLV